jgi:hypothetical protein
MRLTELSRELASSVRAAWDTYRETLRGETPYAFGLYVVSENGQIVASAYATEQATARRAEEYAFMIEGNDTTRARIIRWWDADWPHVNDLRSLFDEANALIARAPVPRDAYVDALLMLDRSLFGDVVLGVFGGDRKDIDRSIARLNTPAIVERYRAEVSAAEREYAALSG